MEQTIESSEECLLERHRACKGEVALVSTAMVTVRVPCQCTCHDERY